MWSTFVVKREEIILIMQLAYFIIIAAFYLSFCVLVLLFSIFLQALAQLLLSLSSKNGPRKEMIVFPLRTISKVTISQTTFFFYLSILHLFSYIFEEINVHRPTTERTVIGRS
jgi:hypothetical protein